MFALLGHLFDIMECNFKTVLLNRMQRADMKKIEQCVQTRVKESVRTPKPIFEKARCLKFRSWTFDPTVVLEQDIVDHKGRILKERGAVHNPLHGCTLSTRLVFIEGTDSKQVAWALQQKKSKIVLVNGSCINLEEKHGIPFYFDQGGFLCNKFGIAAFPARVFQKGHILQCQEITHIGCQNS